MKLHFSSYLSILMLVFLVSCAQKPSPALTDITCAPPCWRGITFDSTQEEVLQKLEGMTDVDKESITQSIGDWPYGQSLISWKFASLEEGGNIFIYNNAASKIILGSQIPMPLSRLLDIYGEPDGVIIQKQKLDWEFLQVCLIYNKGIAINYSPNTWYPLKKYQDYRVKPSDKVREVYYVDGRLLDWQINLACDIEFSMAEYNSNIQLWKGYQSYPVVQHRIQ